MDRIQTTKALLKFQKNPALFFEKALGISTLEEYQRGVIQIVADHERTAIAACHDLGKTYLMARIVLWFVSCFPYSKVITTAPTYNQVKNVLWSEIRAAHSRAKIPLGGKMNTTDWQVTKEGDWFAIGFSPKNEVGSAGEGQGTQSSFQGFHAPHILVLFDEATGIKHGIWTMAEGLLTSDSVKFVAIGNPTSRSAEFYNCFKSAAWKKIYLSCFDSPNLLANGINDMVSLEKELARVKAMPDADAQAHFKTYTAPRPYLLSTKWVIASILKWGLTHPLTVSKILGKFPEEGDNTLIGLGWVEMAQARTYTPLPSDRKIIGIDVARFGTDSTVLTVLHGKQELAVRQFSKRDTMAVAGEAIALSREFFPNVGADIFVVDETGLGAGVVDALNEAVRTQMLRNTTEIRGVQFGAGVECTRTKCEHKDCDKARYVNLKARMFGLLQSDIKDENGLALLDESIYLEELPTILYVYDSKGRMVIESKDDYKKRTGRQSPDFTDSLALANFGRYDSTTVGSMLFGNDKKTEEKNYAAPFAASLGAQKAW